MSYSVLATKKLQDRGTASGAVQLSPSSWMLHMACMEVLHHWRETTGEIWMHLCQERR